MGFVTLPERLTFQVTINFNEVFILKELTKEILTELFDYNQESGEFKRKFRRREWFDSERSFKIFNSRFANKVIKSRDAHGYLQVNIFGSVMKVHRLIWLYVNGVWPNNIDHINGKRHDNRLVNLRSVTKHENSLNLSIAKNNTSGVTGVCWDKNRGKWISQMEFSGKRVQIGRFDSLLDAVCARRSKEIEMGFHENHGKR